eukprot:6195040-Pleurochrysis_carterae.AAC.2
MSRTPRLVLERRGPAKRICDGDDRFLRQRKTISNPPRRFKDKLNSTQSVSAQWSSKAKVRLHCVEKKPEMIAAACKLKCNFILASSEYSPWSSGVTKRLGTMFLMIRLIRRNAVAW